MGIKQGFGKGITRIDHLVEQAKQFTLSRVKRIPEIVKDKLNLLKNKVAKDIIEAGEKVDSSITFLKNNFSLRPAMEASGIGKIREPMENTHAVGDKLREMISRFEGINLEEAAVKGTGNRLAGESEVKTLVGRGEQYTNGRKNRLKPNIRYQTGEFDYFYETDSAGRLVKFETENLQLTTRTDRLSHSKNTPGKVKGQDHAGHLAGDRFGGSPKIDNLVSQLSDVNLRQYKKIEDEWAAALKETPPKEVTINLEVIYSGNNMRPKKFLVKYTIDGESFSEVLLN
ncbi:DNA/RNA non-specific endonuclease [Bacillus sp. BRMEA1]|nr:DNA/RNA non-specific endonuclease [Neobacillus endophyticus]